MRGQLIAPADAVENENDDRETEREAGNTELELPLQRCVMRV